MEILRQCIYINTRRGIILSGCHWIFGVVAIGSGNFRHCVSNEVAAKGCIKNLGELLTLIGKERVRLGSYLRQ
ncbi:hypothetical protein GCM10027029_35140 [Conyzicola lurida]